METGTVREGRWGRNRDGNGKRMDRHKWGGQRGPGSKISLLVVDVLEYWESYEGQGAD